ncbi:MAG: sporulation initiation factor Spo0A C-terminal domain-containing protein [Lachnospiraceae bacterium]
MENRIMGKQELGMERRVTDIMLEMGIPVHLNGFRYLRKSILMCMEDMELVSSVTKLLYPEVAKRFKTTDQKVERAIRNAIEVSWERGNEETIRELFGYSFMDGKQRPTNSEYIAGIADMIMLDCREDRHMMLLKS